jgi:hypothetical protein
MTELTPVRTPGQVNYEAVWDVMVQKSGRHPGPWAQLPADMREAYEAGAEAVQGAFS